MGTHRIEVAQAGDAPVGLARCQVGQHPLDRGFGVAIGVDGQHRCRFLDWNRFRKAVDRGAAAENQRVAAVAGHRPQQLGAAAHVHIPVEQRLMHRLGYSLEAGEMDHSITAAGHRREGPVKARRLT